MTTVLQLVLLALLVIGCLSLYEKRGKRVLLAGQNGHARGYAFNVTRQTFVASEMATADTHVSRLIGLVATPEGKFSTGKGLWILPCHGVHTFAMSYPIDVIYLSDNNRVIHLEHNVKPWRVTPIRRDAGTVLEVPAHTIWSTGTKVGDVLELERSRKGNGT